MVLPVADLALQVYKVFQMYSEGTHLRVSDTHYQLFLYSLEFLKFILLYPLIQTIPSTMTVDNDKVL